MLRLSVSELSTINWSFEEDVLRYREAGYAAIGIWYPKLVQFGEEKGRELIQESNLAISSLTYASSFTGCKGLNFRRSMLEALDVVQLAADIGAPTVVLMTGGRNGHTRNHAMRILRIALNVLAEAAQAVGVQLAIEPMHQGCAHDSFLNTVPQCLDVIGQVDNPNLGINFDCYHLVQDSAALSWIDSIAPLIRLVQLGDAKCAPLGAQNRCPLGHGRLPLVEVIQLLQSVGYDGYYEIELQGAGVAHLDYAQLLIESRQTAQNWRIPEPCPSKLTAEN